MLPNDYFSAYITWLSQHTWEFESLACSPDQNSHNPDALSGF
jgi:hypothetical protein